MGRAGWVSFPSRWLCRLVVTGVCLAVSAGAPKRALADGRLEWHEAWRRVGVAEYVATGSLGLAAWFVSEGVPPAESPAWTEPILFDAAVRSGLSRDTRIGRDRVATTSDVLVVASILQPLLIDSLLVAGVFDKNADVAHQTGVIDMQAYALTAFLNVSAKRIFARQRPYVTGCEQGPNYSAHCDDLDRYRSYYSGHAAFSATSAGLVCAHHTHLPLYGGGLPDALACGAALGLALTTGTLRMVADRHWASDVITGYIFGFASGYLLPSLLYYGSFRSTELEAEPATTQAPLRPRPPPQLSFAARF